MKAMMFVVLMVMSMAASAWDGVYKQISVNPQEMRTVNGHIYSGRNPTADMYWVIQHFDDAVVMEQLAVIGGDAANFPSGTSWGAFTGVPEGKWIDNFQMVISDGSRHAQAILEEESPTELTLYMYWCEPGSETMDTYEKWYLGRYQDNWYELYRKSSKEVEIGCYVPSRQYIKLEKIN